QGARLPAAIQPAMPPAVRRRRGDAEGGRGGLQRATLIDRAHQREAASQSELGVSVQIHPRPPLSVSPGRPTASKEGRIEPQPFTTSIGGTASYGSCNGRRARRCSRRTWRLAYPIFRLMLWKVKY